MAPIFGYGSLILPTSLVSRFETIDTALDAVYRGDVSETVRGDALDKWEQRRERITYVPAKIRGFRRYYSFESERGDTMLDVVHTDDPGDWINGVLIFGLTEAEREKIAESEGGYELLMLQDPALEYYVEPDDASRACVPNHPEIEIHVSPKEQADVTARKPRNQTYHSRIVAGIAMIGEMYGTEIAREFYEDFRESTYETAYDSSDPTTFNTVKENDDIRGDGKWQIQP